MQKENTKMHFEYFLVVAIKAQCRNSIEFESGRNEFTLLLHVILLMLKFSRETRFSRVRIFEIFENLAFQRFEPIIILDFSWRFRKKTLEKHISKQMKVYKQITFFHKNQNVQKYVSRIEKWIF